MLAAFDLSGYELYNNFTNLTGTSADDFSGVVYLESTDSFFIIDNGANTNNGAIFEYEYNSTFTSLVKQREIVFTGFDDPNLPQPNPDSLREGDPEEIVYLGNNKFAFVREQMGIIHEFLIDADGPDDGNVIDGDTNSDGSTDTVDESTVEDQVLTEITMDKNPNDFDGANTNNDNIEGLAYNPDGNFDSIADDPVYYAVKELNWTDIDSPPNGIEILYQIDASGGTTTSIDVSGLINELGTSNDASGLAFAGGYLFITSERDANKTQVTRLTRTGSNWAFAGGGDDRFSLSGMGQPEAITFSSDGFDMFIVGENREFRHYRNYTDFTPNAAPDMTDASDTRVDGDNITTDTTPTFTGTLTRTVGGNSIPLDGATVFLYVDGVEKGTDETDANGFYSVTPTAALSAGSGQIVTIKVGEETSSIEANQSIASTSVSITIALTDSIADLNIDGFVDFMDLTVLVANWNKPFQTEADGNLVEPTGSTINFQDLAVLVAAWTGPDPLAPAPTADADTVSPAPGTTVDEAAIEIFVDFGEAVSGMGASDMVLSGSGGSAASVAAPSKVRTGIWSFPVSGLLPGTVVVDVARDAGDITKVAGGDDVTPKHWSFTADPGLTLNDGGTGDVALTDNFLGLSSTAVTVEVTFSSDDITAGTSAGTPIFAYVTDDKTDAFTLFVEKDAPNNMKLYVNDVAKTMASGTDVTGLLSGAVRAGYALAV